MYLHSRVQRIEFKSENYLTRIFEAYRNKPELLPEMVPKNCNKEEFERCICDYISGMTDRYAIGEYKKLFTPDEKD